MRHSSNKEAVMIHLITIQNRHLYAEELKSFHRERRQQFIVERGWDLVEREGGEYDDYDDEEALYLLGLADDGELDVGCRLRPTISGGVIPDIFPHLVASHEAPVRRSGVFECTRYFSTARARGRRGFEARSRLHISMQECVRDRGGHRLLGFVDLSLLAHLRRFSGLRIRPIGLPAPYGEDGTTIAFEIGVGEVDLMETRRRLEMPARQLFEAPPWLPKGSDVLAMAQATAVFMQAQSPNRRRLTDFARRVSSRVTPRPDIDGLMARLSAQAG